MFRFIHSSDLHLGKRFGNMPEDLRGRLREARHAVIGRLATHAREHGASLVLLAGDTFDTETPAPEIRRQALAEMGHHAPLRWVLLPGNHDSLQAAQLWNTLHADAPDNVVLATAPEAIPIDPGVALLSAPCTTRRPGRDITEWMDDAATPEGVIRIGLAHGAIQNFSEESAAADIIAPHRATRSGLDYLALGDWHGAVTVGARTHYSGTPEPDRFKHDRPGRALLVSIPAAGALPEVTPVETGTFAWRTVPLRLLSQDNGATMLAAVLPATALRRQTLLRIAASGRTGLAGRTALVAAVGHTAPEFAWLELDESELATDCESEDLDLIRRNGQEEEIDRLSGGMREQLSVLTRLAFARLLARGGRPAPVILDDALVYSDDNRIERMFDALHRQSRDQQIIVFSCRQRAFARLGGNVLRMTDWRPPSA